MTRTRTRARVQLTTGQPLTVTQAAYVAELEARTIRLAQLVDEDLADELARERNRTLNLRRRVDELKSELRHAQMVGRWLRHRNQRLLALLRTIRPRRTPMTALPDIERLQALQLQPGDVLVATVPANITPAELEQVAKDLQHRLPGQQVLVITTGIDLAAYRPATIDAKETTTP